MGDPANRGRIQHKQSQKKKKTLDKPGTALVNYADVVGAEEEEEEEGGGLISAVPGSMVDTNDLAMSSVAWGRPMDLAFLPIVSSFSLSASRSLTSWAISLGSFRYSPKLLSVTYGTLPASCNTPAKARGGGGQEKTKREKIVGMYLHTTDVEPPRTIVKAEALSGRVDSQPTPKAPTRDRAT